MRRLAFTSIALAVLLTGATPAEADVTECSFAGATATVTPADGSVVIAVNEGAITVDGVGCDAATVTNTDTVQVSAVGGDDVTISLAGGAFAPGATDELDGSSEIEFEFEFSPTDADLTIVGTDGADAITGWFQVEAGAPALAFVTFLSLNADEDSIDADITMDDGIPGLTTVELGEGDDRFSATRVGLTPYAGVLFVRAGDGDDTITPSGADGSGSFFFGGHGTDTLTFGPQDASCIGLYTERGGQICDHPISGSVFERLRGHAGPDWLGGGIRLLEASGRRGDDTLFAGPGDGILDGGQGRDMAAFLDLLIPGGVHVDLREGTAHGGGDDVLVSVEDVVGTDFGDVLVGDARSNQLSGEDGDDVLRGRGGVDSLHGGADIDTCDTGLPGVGETVVECEG